MRRFTRRGAPADTGVGRTSRAATAPPDAPLLDDATVRLLRRLTLAPLRTIVGGRFGQRSGTSLAPGAEFSDYRSYAPGDDLRRIDWNIYGRLRELRVKVGPQEEHLMVEILIDTSRSMMVGPRAKLDHARRLAAALGALGLLQSDAVRPWALGNGRAVPGAILSSSKLLAVLADEVSALPVGRDTDLAASLRTYRRAVPRADVAVLISDGLTDPVGLADALGELAASAAATGFLHVTDPADAVPQRGPVLLRDAETGQPMRLNLTPALRTAYAQRYARFAAGVAEACLDAGVSYLRAPTDVSALDLLVDFSIVAGAAGA